ncbi:MAG: hypothetical protein AAGA56_16030 [Myxococcota bacterium]
MESTPEYAQCLRGGFYALGDNLDSDLSAALEHVLDKETLIVEKSDNRTTRQFGIAEKRKL